MTIRFSIERNPLLERLVLAGNGLCCCCAREFTGRSALGTANADPTIEHVFPKHPQAQHLSQIKRLWCVVVARGTIHGRTAAAHASCNRRKGNRPPTGCEVVFLMAVNARLEGPRRKQPETGEATYASPRERRRAKRARAAARRRAAAMQEANA